MQHQLLFSGNDIFLQESKESVGKAFSIKFETEIFVEHDTSKNCKNYPTTDFHDYSVSTKFSSFKIIETSVGM